jgi:hypothetical protein
MEQRMDRRKRIALALVAWTAGVSILHGWLNVDWSSLLNSFRPEAERKLNVAYIPVT